jgi:hypothetical protein
MDLYTVFQISKPYMILAIYCMPSQWNTFQSRLDFDSVGVILKLYIKQRQSQWPRGLRRGSAAVRFEGLGVRISLVA